MSKQRELEQAMVTEAIDAWHDRSDEALANLCSYMPLHEWLGWAREEYVAWVMTGYGPEIKPDAPGYAYAHNAKVPVDLSFLGKGRP